MSDEAQTKLDLVEGGLLLTLEAIKAGDPIDEIAWRIQEELRLIRRRVTVRLPETQKTL